MGWDDRPYYRDRSGSSTNPLIWLLNGSIPLFTAFQIRVRAHVTLLILITVEILLDWQKGYSFEWRAASMGIFTAVIILHEFGHCFMARALGGSANEIMLWPLGGLAFADPPHKPKAVFLTAAAGPAVNVLLCIGTGIALEWIHPGIVILHPFDFNLVADGASTGLMWLWWAFKLNYVLLLFNLLPLWPLDGGQMLQSALWPMVGHFRSMIFATSVGMIGAVVMAVAGLSMHSSQWLLVFVAIFVFISCYQRRIQLREEGPEEWQDGGIDYNASIYGFNENQPRRRKLSRRAINRARRIARLETAERQRIDTILAKVSAHGMHSLGWRERRALRKATERQRRQELELSKFR